MDSVRQPSKPRRMRLLRVVAGAVVLSLGGLVGCNGWWDDFRGNDYKVASMFQKSPDPFDVLKKSKDGDQRARAYQALGEKNIDNLSKAEADYLLAVLSAGAMKEQQLWARINAVQALGNFERPEAAKGLVEAYYRAGSVAPGSATMLKSTILTSLGQTKQTEAMKLLVKVLKEPPVEGAFYEEQQRTDEKIAAARALGKFQYFEATQPLVDTLRHEKNIALRRNAHNSLQAITERDDIPQDAQAWADFISDVEKSGRNIAPEKSIGDHVRDIVPVSLGGKR